MLDHILLSQQPLLITSLRLKYIDIDVLRVIMSNTVGNFLEIMIQAVVTLTLKAAWVKASLKSCSTPRAQGRISFSSYQVCTCLK